MHVCAYVVGCFRISFCCPCRLATPLGSSFAPAGLHLMRAHEQPKGEKFHTWQNRKTPLIAPLASLHHACLSPGVRVDRSAGPLVSTYNTAVSYSRPHLTRSPDARSPFVSLCWDARERINSLDLLFLSCQLNLMERWIVYFNRGVVKSRI